MFTHRRMFPGDIHNCLRDSDMWPAVKNYGLEAEMEQLLLDLMLQNQMWGGVVMSPLSSKPVAFGACVFITGTRADELEEGQHPYLLLDFAQTFDQACHILTFKDVEEDSRKKKLNFYGTLFKLPPMSLMSPTHFFAAISALQENLLQTLSGFGIDRHFKHLYSRNYLRLLLEKAGMKGFGSELIQKYPALNSQPLNCHPFLFEQTKANVDAALSKKDPISYKLTAAQELLCDRDPILALAASMRPVLRLDLEHVPHKNIGPSLYPDAKEDKERTADHILSNVVEHVMKNPAFCKYLRDNGSPKPLDGVRQFVRANPWELGVLPPLTEGEKAQWIAKHGSPSVAYERLRTKAPLPDGQEFSALNG